MDILQFIGTFASVFSIPLAIILYLKTSDVRQNKVRLDIIRTLSHRIGEGEHGELRKIEVSAVFNSKVRENKIRKPVFDEMMLLEDIIADAVSNPFLTSEQKTHIIDNINKLTTKDYNKGNNHPNSNNQKKVTLPTGLFSFISFIFVGIATITIVYADNIFATYRGNKFVIEIITSTLVALLGAISAFFITFNFKPKKKIKKDIEVKEVKSESE